MRAYPPHWLARLFGDADDQTLAGISVSGEGAWKYTVFYACIDLISRAVAALPLHLYLRKDEQDKVKAYSHPIYELLHSRPNPEQTAFVWRQTMQAWVLTWGNAYAEIERNGLGRPVALWPMPPNKTKPIRDEDGNLMYEYRNGNGDPIQIPARDVLHIRTMGDGLAGKSPVRLFAESVGLGMAAQRAGAAFFGNGMRPSGALEHPGSLTEPALANLRKSYEHAYSGSENTGKLLILEEGMKYHGLTIPPEDAQYIETMTFQVRDGARIFHVPVHKLADLADATFSNVEEQNLEWATDGLWPWLVNWEQEIDFKLLWPAERTRYFARFSIEGLLRGNSAARAAFYTALWNIGAIKIDEIRAFEDMNRIEGGDRAFVPLNFIPLEKAGTQPDGNGGTAEGVEEDKDKLDIPTNGQREAIRQLLEVACGRIVRGEAQAIEKAHKRGELPAYAADIFNEDHESRCREILSAPVWAAATSFDSTASREDAQRMSNEIVKRHVREVRAMATEPNRNGELKRWADSEPVRWAADLIARMEFDHANAYAE